MSVSAGGTPDLVHLLMMRKELTAERTRSTDLLQMLPQQPPVSRPAPSPGTWYL